MESLALWYIPKETNNKKLDLELHINYWKLPTRNSFKRFLDLGLKIKEPNQIEKICLYLPFSIDIQEIQDLGGIISKNRKLLTAIFNENWNITLGESEHYVKVTDQNDKFVFDIVIIKDIINKNEELQKYIPTIKLNNANNGCIMEIYLPGQLANSVYLRFRIRSSSLERLSFVYIPHDSFFQSALLKTELLDFRINSVRDLPEDILHRIKNEGEFFLLKKLHFLFICDAAESLVLEPKSFNKIRLLEQKIWKKYLPELPDKKPLIAYHWKEIYENGSINFNTLIKTKFRHTNWWKIGKYLGILFLIGIITNFISAFLCNKTLTILSLSNNKILEHVSKEETKVRHKQLKTELLTKQKHIKRSNYVDKNDKDRF